MRAYIVKPVPIHMQKQFANYAKTNAYRFVFFNYGTNDRGAPHYALYTWEHINPIALLYISEYILEEIVAPPYNIN